MRLLTMQRLRRLSRPIPVHFHLERAWSVDRACMTLVCLAHARRRFCQTICGLSLLNELSPRSTSFSSSQIALKKPIRRKKKSEIDFEIALANQQRKREEAGSCSAPRQRMISTPRTCALTCHDWDKGGDDTKLGDFLGHAQILGRSADGTR